VGLRRCGRCNLTDLGLVGYFGAPPPHFLGKPISQGEGFFFTDLHPLPRESCGLKKIAKRDVKWQFAEKLRRHDHMIHAGQMLAHRLLKRRVKGEIFVTAGASNFAPYFARINKPSDLGGHWKRDSQSIVNICADQSGFLGIPETLLTSSRPQHPDSSRLSSGHRRRYYWAVYHNKSVFVPY
jgi:hypothetical protein